jgi:hypothetical protein
MTAPSSTRPVAIGELVAAWNAVQRGEFRDGHQRAATAAADRTPPRLWEPEAGETPVLVAGCQGSCGVSTTALLLATAAGRARVVECAAGACSGLAGAATAELGCTDSGWIQGSRDRVLLQRRPERFTELRVLPLPPRWEDAGLTLVDCPWELTQVLASQSWLGAFAAGCERVVLVCRTTVPGLRRLENYLALLGPDRCHVVAIGPPPRRWPRTVTCSLGPVTRNQLSAGRLVSLPEHPGLATNGITADELPPSLLPPALELLKGLLS